MANKKNLLEANTKFYEAIESLKLVKMEAVWAKNTHVWCIHPGWPTMHGLRAVLNSWKHIMLHTPSIQFGLQQIQASLHDNVGFITLQERIKSAEGSVSFASATNIFIYSETDAWKMLAHHASASPAIKEQHNLPAKNSTPNLLN